MVTSVRQCEGKEIGSSYNNVGLRSVPGFARKLFVSDEIEIQHSTSAKVTLPGPTICLAPLHEPLREERGVVGEEERRQSALEKAA